MRKRYWIIIAGFVLWVIGPFLKSSDNHLFREIGDILGWLLVIPLVLLVAVIIYLLISYIDKLINPGISKKNNIDKYLSVRDSLQIGDVIAFKGQGLFAWAISIVSRYTHVGMVVRFSDLKGGDRVFILEALDQKGIVLMPLSAKLFQYRGKADWFKLNVPQSISDPVCRDSIYQFLMQQLGKNYDYMSIKRIIEKFLNILDFRRYEDTTRMICSELVAEALNNAGLCSIKDCSTITPEQITEQLVLNTGVRVFNPGVKIL